MEKASEGVGSLLGFTQFRRTGTEELRVGVELLVDLQTGHEAQVLVITIPRRRIERAHWSVVRGRG
jgi:hypothetical protein